MPRSLMMLSQDRAVGKTCHWLARGSQISLMFKRQHVEGWLGWACPRLLSWSRWTMMSCAGYKCGVTKMTSSNLKHSIWNKQQLHDLSDLGVNTVFGWGVLFEMGSRMYYQTYVRKICGCWRKLVVKTYHFPRHIVVCVGSKGECEANFLVHLPVFVSPRDSSKVCLGWNFGRISVMIILHV